MAAQYCDAEDLNNYLGPMIAVTGFASFLGFVASSSLFANDLFLRSMISLASGFLAVMSTAIITVRNKTKFDIKVTLACTHSIVQCSSSTYLQVAGLRKRMEWALRLARPCSVHASFNALVFTFRY